MTSFKDILNITVPKIPDEFQEEVLADESYAYTGCIDMIVALGLDADVIWEEKTDYNDDGEEIIVKEGYCTADLTLEQKWLAALYSYKVYLEKLKVSMTVDAINFSTLTFSIKGLEKRPENINDTLYRLDRYLNQEINRAIGASAILGTVVSYGGD